MDTRPLALLIALDGTERVWAIEEPPRPAYYVARHVPFTVKFSKDPVWCEPLPPHREVRLASMRSSSHKWLRVYNEGRSATPEDAYVYLEARAPHGEEP